MCIQGGVEHLLRICKRQSLRKLINVPLNAKLLLSVGELNKNKNHELVIRTVAELQNKNIYYAIAGTGELFDYLRELSESLGVGDRIRLLGYYKDIDNLYKAADIFILPSLREGLNVSLMEAIAAKLPIACSNIRGNIDLIEESEVLFDFKNIKELKKCISYMCKSDVNEMIEKHYQILCKFDSEEIVHKTEKIYSEIAS